MPSCFVGDGTPFPRRQEEDKEDKERDTIIKMKREREDSLLVLVETSKKRKSKRVKVVALHTSEGKEIVRGAAAASLPSRLPFRFRLLMG